MIVQGARLLAVRQGKSAAPVGKDGLNDNWIALGSLADRLVVSWNRIAVLTPGHVLIAEDGLNGTWSKEAGNVTSFAADG